MGVHVVTYCTNTTFLLALRLSLSKVNVPLILLPVNHAHRQPHWQKIYALSNLVQHFPPNDLILYADAYDTIVQQDGTVIYNSYLKYVLARNGNTDRALIFNGIGTKCFPYEIQSKAWPSNLLWNLDNARFTGTDACNKFKTKFPGENYALNSGLILGRAYMLQRFMGRVWALRKKPFYTDQSTVIAVAHVFSDLYVDSNSTLFQRPWRRSFCTAWDKFPYGNALAFHLTGLPSLRSQCRRLASRQ